MFYRADAQKKYRGSITQDIIDLAPDYLIKNKYRDAKARHMVFFLLYSTYKSCIYRLL